VRIRRDYLAEFVSRNGNGVILSQRRKGAKKERKRKIKRGFYARQGAYGLGKSTL